MVSKGKRGQRRDKLGVWDYQIGTIKHKIDKQQDLLYITENYTITYNGKESEKGCIEID